MSFVECIFPQCSNPARKHGKECRRCYKRVWAQRKRAASSGEPRPQSISLDAAKRELERRAYLDWYGR